MKWIEWVLVQYTEDLAFCDKARENGFKIYRPLSKKFKWLCSPLEGNIQGFLQLPDKGKLLIITSSLKDVMLLDVMKYNAIAPHTEGGNLREDLINSLKERFKRIVMFYDNDSTGIENSKTNVLLFKLEEIFIPKEKLAKDISDFRKKYGEFETIKLLKIMLTQKVEIENKCI